MKKSMEAPERPVREKNPQKPSIQNSRGDKVNPFRKSETPVAQTIRSEKPNAHSPVDDELDIPDLRDKEAGKYTPTQDPW